MTDPITRLIGRIERLPAPLRPAASGMAMVLGFMLMRGTLYLVPLFVVFVLLKSATPARDIALGAGVVALAVVAGGLGGLAYGAFGVPARRVPRIGPYLAGIVGIAPYMLVVYVINQALDHRPLFARPSAEDVVIYAVLIVLFGIVLGHAMFAPDATIVEESENGDS